MVPCEPVPTSLPEQSKDKRYNDPQGADGETQSINLLRLSKHFTSWSMSVCDICCL